jgi:regulator of sigma E protease
VAPTTIPPVVDTLIAGKPAIAAGFQKGDSITAVDGVAVHEWNDVLREVSAKPGAAITVDVVRGGAPVSMRVTTEAQDEPDSATGASRKVGRIGMGPLVRAVGPIEAVQLGATGTVRMAGQVVGVVRGLLKGSVGVDQLGGPIAIARVSVQQAKRGWEDLFGLIAFLSINLAVLNLLPVPILDGGQILVTVAEGVRGKPLTIRTREWLMRAGVAFILVLFTVVMFNDLKSLLSSLWK